MIGHYQTARAFRAALEERLKQLARAQSIDLMRLRRQVAFDRLLARLFAEPHAAALSREQQFAEKVHAYTLPRGERTNTRVKDLVDLVLLIELGLPDAEAARRALRATFERRATHPMPATLELPPAEWQAAFKQLAAEVDLGVASLDAAFDVVAAYWRTLVP